MWPPKSDPKGLVCKFQFAKTQFADEVFQLYKDGYLKAFSIGFIPLDYDEETKTHKRISLLEVSAVPVPANQSALVMEAYQKGIITSDILKKDFGVSEPDPALEEVKAEADGVEVIDKPETTDNYHRVPVDKGDHSGHKIRTIDIDKKKGIKALYCVDCKKVITYLFPTESFTMAEAEAWVRDHKDVDLDTVETTDEERHRLHGKGFTETKDDGEDPLTWNEFTAKMDDFRDEIVAEVRLASLADDTAALLKSIPFMVNDALAAVHKVEAAVEEVRKMKAAPPAPAYLDEGRIEVHKSTIDAPPPAPDPAPVNIVDIVRDSIRELNIKAILADTVKEQLAKLRGRVE